MHGAPYGFRLTNFMNPLSYAPKLEAALWRHRRH